ncbi:nanos homolog 3 isoform X2 [Rousettus aegyptiacus]|uniref:nanos homolog 3 isoform X2 n=1 Tax=Rousettus aegyptiacus TaxID=9407 RepID=UPI00168CCD76|nr:nanos homolog 3 isoform X2 [Rousettus aegyptiacus]
MSGQALPWVRDSDPCMPFPVFVVRVPLCAYAPPALLRSACVRVPACARSRPRVPGAGPWSCVLAPRGHPRVCPAAPGRRPRGTHGRGWTHRPARRGEEGGGGGGGERGHVTETDRLAGRRRRPRVRAGAGAPRPPPPVHGVGSPRPALEPPKCNFPCRRLGSGGFSGRVLETRGDTRRRPKTRFQRCWEVVWTFAIFLLPLHFRLGGRCGEDVDAAFSWGLGP